VAFGFPDRTIAFGESGVANSVEILGRNFLPTFDILNETPMDSLQRDEAQTCLGTVNKRYRNKKDTRIEEIEE
jgi:hypothetical protein